MDELSPLDAHLTALAEAIVGFRSGGGRLAHWGVDLARHLGRGDLASGDLLTTDPTREAVA